jgi:hypothetical protein
MNNHTPAPPAVLQKLSFAASHLTKAADCEKRFEVEESWKRYPDKYWINSATQNYGIANVYRSEAVALMNELS